MINTKKLFKDFISTDELKPALLGVYYNAETQELVATDGHKLLVLSGYNAHFEVTGLSGIIPLSIFEQFDKISKPYASQEGPSPVLIVLDEKSCTLLGPGTQYSEELIDEQYPDYNSVIPEKQAADADGLRGIGVNGLYLGQIATAFNQRPRSYSPNLELHFGGSEIAPVLIDCPNFRDTLGVKIKCLLMPIRLGSI